MVKITNTLACAAVAAVTLLVPGLAAAQTQQTPLDARFLVSGLAHQSQGQAQQQQVVEPDPPGIGIGVKGGLLFSSFRDARTDYKNSAGWQGSLFLGGNRAGALGIMTELTYAKKGAKSGSVTTDTYYLEIPLLLRMNIGSSNRNTGASLYFIAGPAADILLKAKLSGIDIKDQYKDLDWNFIGGAGVELSRLIIEGRFNWGLQNVLEGPGNELKTRSFAILGGLRFN